MLSDTEILSEMKTGNIVITPFEPKQLGANSYDLRLGNWFIELLGYRYGKPVFGDFFSKKDGQTVTIPVGGTLLAMTKEVAGGKHDIVPSVRTRSSIRRNGIDICAAAGLGDVGYINHWTVELTSFVRGISVLEFDEPSLVVGETFAQIVFDRVAVPPTNPYHGQYTTEEWPLCMLPKSHRDQYNYMTYSLNNEVKIKIGG